MTETSRYRDPAMNSGGRAFSLFCGFVIVLSLGTSTGCLMTRVQDVALTRAEWSQRSTAAIARDITPEKPLKLIASQLAPSVAYEWLASAYLAEGKTDDAILALLLSAVLDLGADPRSESQTATGRAVLKQVSELLGRKEGAERNSFSAWLDQEEYDAVIGQMNALADARPAGLACKDQKLVADATRIFRRELAPPSRGKTKRGVNFLAANNTVSVAAVGLALLRHHEDWPYIEPVLATNPYLPMLHPYIRFCVEAEPQMRQKLMAHPGGMVRANALIALRQSAARGEKDALIRVAGAFSPAAGESGEAVAVLQKALGDERHCVRSLALTGLLKHQAPLSGEQIAAAVIPVRGGAPDGEAVNCSGYVNGFRVSFLTNDVGLEVDGFRCLAKQDALSAGAFQWGLDRLRKEPSLAPELQVPLPTNLFNSAGYPNDTFKILSRDSVNLEWAKMIGRHASLHQERFVEAMRAANPYTRLYLQLAAKQAAKQAAIEKELWNVAEQETLSAEDDEYQKKFAKQVLSQMRAPPEMLMFSPQFMLPSKYSTSFYATDRMFQVVVIKDRAVERMIGMMLASYHFQARFAAIQALAHEAGDKTVNRLARMLDMPAVSRVVAEVLLEHGKEAILRNVPGDFLEHEEKEARLVSAVLLLYASNDSRADKVLRDELRDNESAVAFAAQMALKIDCPALSRAVVAAKGVPAVSYAGHLVRRVEQKSASVK